MSKVSYVGAFLTKESREELLRRFPSFHENVHADHVTLIFDPNEETAKNTPIGHRVKVLVVAYAINLHVQAVRVSGLISKNTYPHITISCARDVKPVTANNLLQETQGGLDLITPFELDAVIDNFPRTVPTETE